MKTLLLLAVALTPAAATSLYSIAGDSFGVQREFKLIDPATGSVSTLFTLGDGSVAYNGGLSYNSYDEQFYAVANDPFGTSALVAFDLLGNPGGPITALGFGFLGGLAYAGGGTFYAIGDNAGVQTLYSVAVGSVTPLFAMPSTHFFNGGLALDSSTGSLYAIGSDLNGLSSLHQINVVTQSATVVGPQLGYGFFGGLAASNGLFHAVATDPMAQSTLWAFDLDDAAPTPIAALGLGYYSAGLTYAPEPVPEPAYGAAAAALLVAISLHARNTARR